MLVGCWSAGGNGSGAGRAAALGAGWVAAAGCGVRPLSAPFPKWLRPGRAVTAARALPGPRRSERSRSPGTKALSGRRGAQRTPRTRRVSSPDLQRPKTNSRWQSLLGTSTQLTFLESSSPLKRLATVCTDPALGNEEFDTVIFFFSFRALKETLPTSFYYPHTPSMHSEDEGRRKRSSTFVMHLVGGQPGGLVGPCIKKVR